MVQKRRILPYYLLIYYIPDGNDNLENFFQISIHQQEMIYLDIEKCHPGGIPVNLNYQQKNPHLAAGTLSSN